MTDIVERLREWAETPYEGDPMIDALLDETQKAATLIEQQRALVEEIGEIAGYIRAIANGVLYGEEDRLAIKHHAASIQALTAARTLEDK